jgi:hypothetical protein
VGRPLQLVSESVSSTPQVHASFFAVPLFRTINTINIRLNAAIASVAFQMPVVGREPMRYAVAGVARAVVTIEAVEITPTDVGVTELGVSVQDEFAGAPVQVKATDELKPFSPVTVAITPAVVPAATLTVVGTTVTEKSGFVVVPVPVSVAVCGLLASLSATPSVAVTGPVAVGVNVTLIVQVAPTASVEPHALV